MFLPLRFGELFRRHLLGQFLLNPFEVQTFVGLTGSNIGIDYLVKKQFLPFEEAIRKLRMEMQEGQPDFDQFYASINQTVDGDAELRKYGDELILATTDAEAFARRLLLFAANGGTSGTTFPLFRG